MKQAKAEQIGDLACPPSQAVLNATDRINRGDRVSWRFDSQERRYGRVLRITTHLYQRAFAVKADDDDTSRIIVPARYITAERG